MSRQPIETGRRRAAHLAVPALIALFLVWQSLPFNLQAYPRDFDEGVYAQSAWALMAGARPFGDLFSAQPPLVAALAGWAFGLLGPSLAAGRLVTVVLSCGGLLGVALLAGSAGRGPASGGLAAGLLLASPLFLDLSRQLNPELPAVCLAALALGCLARRRAGGSAGWLVGAGFAFAAATLCKLTALAAAPALLLLLAQPASGRRGRAAGLVHDAALVFAPPAVGWLVVLLATDPSAAFDQLWSYRARARGAFPLHPADNLGLLARTMFDDPPVWLAGLAGGLWLSRRRKVAPLVPVLVWLLVGLGGALANSPAFLRHFVLALPPLAVLGAVGLVDLWAASSGSRRRWVCAVLVLLVAVGLVRGVQVGLAEARAARAAAQQAGPVIAALTARVPPAATVLTDEPAVAFGAGRRVPAWLADSSAVRVSTGDLTIGDLERADRDGRLGAALLARGQLRRVPGFESWLRERFRLADEPTPGVELWLRS